MGVKSATAGVREILGNFGDFRFKRTQYSSFEKYVECFDWSTLTSGRSFPLFVEHVDYCRRVRFKHLKCLSHCLILSTLKLDNKVLEHNSHFRTRC